MSFLKEKDYKPQPDRFDLIRYFNHMKHGLFLYVCVISEENGTPRIYLEKSSDENTFEGIIRVFYRLQDAEAYASAIALNHDLPLTSIKRWDLTSTKAVEYFKEMAENWRKKGRKNIKVVSSLVKDDDIWDLDLFWTNYTDIMV